LFDSTHLHTYSFTAFRPKAIPITCLAQSPAIDVVAIGFLDGTVHLFDIRAGEKLLDVRMGQPDQQDDRAITGITFRDGASDIVDRQLAPADST
jgi:hypothetical protein